MPANVTVTGKIGPASTLTTQLFSGCQSFRVNPDSGILRLVKDDGTNVDIDISAQTTFTVTISGTTFTVTVS